MSLISFSGWIAFITSLIGLLPQVYKAIQSQSTADLSMLMLANYAICSLSWIVYGSATDSVFVLSSNIIGLIVSLLLIGIKKYYDSRALRL